MKGPQSLGILDHKKRANRGEWIGKAQIIGPIASIIGANSLCNTLHTCRLHAHRALARAFCLEADGRSTVPDTRPLPKETRCVLKGLAPRPVA